MVDERCVLAMPCLASGCGRQGKLLPSLPFPVSTGTFCIRAEVVAFQAVSDPSSPVVRMFHVICPPHVRRLLRLSFSALTMLAAPEISRGRIRCHLHRTPLGILRMPYGGHQPAPNLPTRKDPPTSFSWLAAHRDDHTRPKSPARHLRITPDLAHRGESKYRVQCPTVVCRCRPKVPSTAVSPNRPYRRRGDGFSGPRCASGWTLDKWSRRWNWIVRR